MSRYYQSSVVDWFEMLDQKARLVPAVDVVPPGSEEDLDLLLGVEPDVGHRDFHSGVEGGHRDLLGVDTKTSPNIYPANPVLSVSE